VVEVSDTTLRLDRGRKLAAYARTGIAEYWIVNLREHRLEVYRNPRGEEYHTIQILGDEDVISPLHAPQATIRVADLLPPVPAGQDSASSS
jgi:Uma2 family endonuclease